MDAFAPYLIEEIQRHGVKDWEIDTTGRHNKLRFVWQDKQMMHVFPKTPSDSNGMLNNISTLRREMGVRRIIRKSKNPKKHKAKQVVGMSAPKNISLAPRTDPFACLAKLKEAQCPVMTLSQMVAMLNSVPR